MLRMTHLFLTCPKGGVLQRFYNMAYAMGKCPDIRLIALFRPGVAELMENRQEMSKQEGRSCPQYV